MCIYNRFKNLSCNNIIKKMDEMKVNEVFPKKLRERLDTLKVSQKDFAKNIGTTTTTVQRWLTGENSPPLKKIDAIASLLECTPESLLLDVSGLDKESLIDQFKEAIKKEDSLSNSLDLPDSVIEKLKLVKDKKILESYLDDILEIQDDPDVIDAMNYEGDLEEKDSPKIA